MQSCLKGGSAVLGTWRDMVTPSHPATTGARPGTLAPSRPPSHHLGSGVVMGKIKARFGCKESVLLPSPPQKCRCLFPHLMLLPHQGLEGSGGAGAFFGWISFFPLRWSMGMQKAWQQFGPHKGSPMPPVGWGHSAPCPPCPAQQQQ